MDQNRFSIRDRMSLSSTLRRCLVVSVLALGARTAMATGNDVAPSTCAFDPITIDSFLWHVKAVPAGAADIFRITYDVDRGEAEFVGTGQPRPFTTLDSDDPTILGTLTLPSTFRVRVLSTGDLFASLTVTLQLFNVFEAVFPLDFTTGLPSGETFAEGIPLSSDGHFKLVSAREGLPL